VTLQALSLLNRLLIRLLSLVSELHRTQCGAAVCLWIARPSTVVFSGKNYGALRIIRM